MSSPSQHFVFDAYGTLFDVHSAARQHGGTIGEAWPRLSEIWRNKQLEYTWIYARLDRHVPFREITRRALAYALTVTGQPLALAPKLLETYDRLATFPEVPDVLSALKSRGAKLAILSNGDADMLGPLVQSAGLAGMFDAVFSVASAGTFKPAARVYGLVSDHYRVAPSAITFLSSNRWDVAGARDFGFEPIWINRSGMPDEYPDLPAARVLSNLAPLAS